MAPGESEQTGVIARAVLATVTGKRMFGLELPVVTPPAPDERDRQERCGEGPATPVTITAGASGAVEVRYHAGRMAGPLARPRRDTPGSGGRAMIAGVEASRDD